MATEYPPPFIGLSRAFPLRPQVEKTPGPSTSETESPKVLEAILEDIVEPATQNIGEIVQKAVDSAVTELKSFIGVSPKISVISGQVSQVVPDPEFVEAQYFPTDFNLETKAEIDISSEEKDQGNLASATEALKSMKKGRKKAKEDSDDSK